MTLKLTLLSATLFATAHAGVVYNEAVSGDLSNSGLNPTVLAVGLGSNQVFGTTGNVGGTDRDYFTFFVPSNLQLTAITVLPGTTVAGVGAFIGMQAGPQVTLSTNATTATGLLGWKHYNPADINTDILPPLAVSGNGSSGFVAPLGTGNYSFWVQEFGGGTFPYGFDFTLAAAPVPEPASYITMISALGALILVLARRPRSRFADGNRPLNDEFHFCGLQG
jgi:hypothetical protein